MDVSATSFSIILSLSDLLFVKVTGLFADKLLVVLSVFGSFAVGKGILSGSFFLIESFRVTQPPFAPGTAP